MLGRANLHQFCVYFSYSGPTKRHETRRGPTEAEFKHGQRKKALETARKLCDIRTRIIRRSIVDWQPTQKQT